MTGELLPGELLPGELLSALLVGTERAAEAETRQLPESPEAALLSLAGAHALRQRAGRLPPRLLSPLPSPPADALPTCGPETTKYLTRVLAGLYPALLAPCLEEVTAAGVRVPEIVLPDLLDRGSRRASLRPLVIAAGGAAGAFLAQQRSEWRYAAPESLSWETLQQDWQSKILSVRQGALARARAHDPALGLDLLGPSWRSGNAAVWMLQALAPQLCAADEPFLERALDHRLVSLRRKATDLLARLPNARLISRMTAAATEILHYRPRLKRIDVRWPEVVPNAWLRDGVILRTWKDKDKVRAAQIADLLGAVPLTHWLSSWDVTPADLLNAAERSEDKTALLKGFALAAERQRRADVAAELLGRDLLGPTSSKLVKVLGPAEVVTLAKTFMSTGQHTALIKLCGRFPGAWPGELPSLFLAALEGFLQHEAARAELSEPEPFKPEPSKPSSLVKTALRQCAQHAPLGGAADLSSSISNLTEGTVYAPFAARTSELLAFRSHFKTALEQETS